MRNEGNGCLGRAVPPTIQTTTAGTEDQVRTFLGTHVDESRSISVANADRETDDLWSVLIGAPADENSVSHRCEIAEGPSDGNTSTYYPPHRVRP